jgi:hypothetical protein
VLIASLWLGTLAFQTLVVGPALNSLPAQTLTGPKFFAYISGGMSLILATWSGYLGLICAALATVHLFVENLYLGRGVGRRWLALLLGLLVLNLAACGWLNPKLTALHQAQYRATSTAAERVAAGQAFRLWHGVVQAVHVFMLGGVALVLWRASHPADTPRYISSGKFRG